MKKVVLITGSSTGIGFLTAKRLAQAGFIVYASMREVAGRNKTHADNLLQFSEGQGVTIRPIELDVTSDVSVREAMATLKQQEERIDILINNAGIWGPGMMEAFTMEQWHHYFEVNLLGCIRTLKAVLPAMRQQKRGLVITISSLQARFILPYGGPNLATKWALDAASEAYRYELAPFGVEFSTLEPFDMMTEMKQKASLSQAQDQAIIDEYGPQTWDYIKNAYLTPDLSRAGDPNSVVDAIEAVINSPEGQRPLRVTVQNPFPQIDQINQLQADVQTNLFGWIGATQLLTPVVNQVSGEPDHQ